ncbi:unnamed protein product [Trichobilharzia szidati]|nr:unnamed protein product [Trichobilharzia szidati]
MTGDPLQNTSVVNNMESIQQHCIVSGEDENSINDDLTMHYNMTDTTDGLTLIASDEDLVNLSTKSSFNGDGDDNNNNNSCFSSMHYSSRQSSDDDDQTVAMCLSNSLSPPYLEDSQNNNNYYYAMKCPNGKKLNDTDGIGVGVGVGDAELMTYFNQDLGSSLYRLEPTRKKLSVADVVYSPLDACRRCHSHPVLKFNLKSILSPESEVSIKIDNQYYNDEPTSASPVNQHASLKDLSTNDCLTKMLNSPLSSVVDMVVITGNESIVKSEVDKYSPIEFLPVSPFTNNNQSNGTIDEQQNTELSGNASCTLNLPTSSPSSSPYSSCSPSSNNNDAETLKSSCTGRSVTVNHQYTPKTSEPIDSYTPDATTMLNAPSDTTTPITGESLLFDSTSIGDKESKLLDTQNNIISFPAEEIDFISDPMVHVPVASSIHCTTYSNHPALLSSLSSSIPPEGSNSSSSIPSTSTITSTTVEYNSLSDQHISPSCYYPPRSHEYLSEYTTSPQNESLPILVRDHEPDFSATELTHSHHSVLDTKSILITKEFFNTPLSSQEDKTLLCDTEDILSESSNFVSPDTDQLICGSAHSYSSSVLSNIFDQSDCVVVPPVLLPAPITTSSCTSSSGISSVGENYNPPMNKSHDMNLFSKRPTEQLHSLPLINPEVFPATTTMTTAAASHGPCTTPGVVTSTFGGGDGDGAGNTVVSFSQLEQTAQQTRGLEKFSLASDDICQQASIVYDMMKSQPPVSIVCTSNNSIFNSNTVSSLVTRTKTKRGGAAGGGGRKNSKTTRGKQSRTRSSVLPASSSLSMPPSWFLDCNHPMESSSSSSQPRRISCQVVPMSESTYNISYDQYNQSNDTNNNMCNSIGGGFPSGTTLFGQSMMTMMMMNNNNSLSSNPFSCDPFNSVGSHQQLPTTSYCCLTPIGSGASAGPYNVNMNLQAYNNAYNNANELHGIDNSSSGRSSSSVPCPMTSPVPISSCSSNLDSQYCNMPMMATGLGGGAGTESYQCNQSSFLIDQHQHHDSSRQVMTPHPGVVMDQYTSDILLNSTNNPSILSGIKMEGIVPSTPIYPIYSEHTGFPVVSSINNNNNNISNAISSHFQLSSASSTLSPSTGVSCCTTNNSILVKPEYQHNYSGNCNQSSILPFQHSLLDNNNNNSGVPLTQLLPIGGGGVGSIVQPSFSNIPCDFMSAASSSSSSGCIPSNLNQSNHFTTPAVVATPSIAGAAASGSTNASNLYANQLNIVGRHNPVGVSVGKHHQTLSHQQQQQLQQQQQDISPPPRLLALPNSNNYMPHFSSSLVEAAVYQHQHQQHPNLQKDSLYTNHNLGNNYFYNPYKDDDYDDDNDNNNHLSLVVNHPAVGGGVGGGIQPASLVVDWTRNDMVSGTVGGHFTPIPYHPMPT